MSSDLSTGKASEAVLQYLQTRRSCPLKLMGDKGPSRAEIDMILKTGARIPDHGKLFPWYFIVLEGKARQDAGELLRKAYLSEEDNASEAKLALETERFLRAAVVILVVSRIRLAKRPVWEQILSAGALCYNICLAANANGYGTNWLTEWYSYNESFKEALGLDERDHIAGAIYIGDVTGLPEDRDRPDLAQITTFWQKGCKLNKGDLYERERQEVPMKGFYFPDDFL